MYLSREACSKIQNTLSISMILQGLCHFQSDQNWSLSDQNGWIFSWDPTENSAQIDQKMVHFDHSEDGTEPAEA